MRINTKEIIRELVPPVVLKVLKFIKHYKSDSDLCKEDISTLEARYNLQFNKESVVLGNGPSLKNTLTNHLSFFDNKTVFCVNNFVVSDYFEIIKPMFYVFADSAMWSENCSPKITGYRNNIFIQLNSKVNWQMFLLLPTFARNYEKKIKSKIENKNIIVSYYNLKTSSSEIEKRYILYRKNKAMPHCQTVLVAPLFLSLNLGFKTSYLVGADLTLHTDIFVNKNNVVCIYDKHFYDKTEAVSVSFWKSEDENDIFKMDELFLALSNMFKGFWELEGYAKYLGVKIYNASHNSFVDAFERYDIE